MKKTQENSSKDTSEDTIKTKSNSSKDSVQLHSQFTTSKESGTV